MKKVFYGIFILCLIVFAAINVNVALNSEKNWLKLFTNTTALADIENPTNPENPVLPSQTFSDRMTHIFKLVDKSKITTGLLSDYGLQIIDPKFFDGIPADSNYVDMDAWRNLYSGIFSSKINSNVSLAEPETVFAQIENATHATAVPVVMMHYQYNIINANALTLGLLQIANNDQLKDVPGAASPYLTKQLFAVAPKELYFYDSDGTVSFVFKSNLFFSNAGKTIQKREINFNNQSGWILAALDTPVSYSLEGGLNTIYFRLTYTDNTSYTSQTNIYVKAETMFRGGGVKLPEINIPEVSGQHAGGKIQIQLSSQNNTGKIKKPLIIAGEMDPTCIPEIKMTIIQDIDYYIKKLTAADLNNTNLYDALDLAGYDVIVLYYNKGVDDIWKNAKLFRQVIDTVNIRKQKNNSSEQNVVMGLSMGGLVSRIALRKMEIDGVNHQTKMYISVDAPHKGANIPVGFQAFLRHVDKIAVWWCFAPLPFPIYRAGNIDAVKGAVKLLNSVAAQQMLIYYMKPDYSYDNSVNSVRNKFQSDYDALGFPQGLSNQPIENIAISNGSALGSTSGGNLFEPGSPIISYQFSYDFKWWMDLLSLASYGAILTNYPQVAWNTIPGHSELRAEVNIDALKNKTVSRVYKGKIYIEKKILFLLPVNITLENVSLNSAAYMLPLDGAPGGYYDLDDLIEDLPFSEDEIKQKFFSFIPSGSSLALNSWDNLTQTITSTTPKAQYISSIFYQNTNEPHVKLSSSASYLYGELTNTYQISGNDIVPYEGSVYCLSNVPSNATVTWALTSGTAFSLSSMTGNPVTVYREPTGTEYGTLTAYINGVNVKQKAITACTAASLTSSTTLVCYSGGSASLTVYNPPSGYSWSYSSNLKITYSSGNSISVSPVSGNSSTPGELAWVSVKYNNKELARKEIWLGAPTIAIDGPDLVSGSGRFYAVHNPLSEPRFTWIVDKPSPNHQYSISNYGSYVDIYFQTPGTYGIFLAASNCGSVDTYKYVTYARGGGEQPYFTVYPNPASDILYVEIDAEIAQETLVSDARNSGLTFDVRLYDGIGNLLQQRKTKGGTVEFNVSNLRNGIYYLHIYDGVNSKPEMKQIIVEH